MPNDFQAPQGYASTPPLPVFLLRANYLEVEMSSLGLNAITLAAWSSLPAEYVLSVLRTRRASKRILVALRRGLRFAALDAKKKVDHISLGYLADVA